jgi:hypothetical protein
LPQRQVACIDDAVAVGVAGEAIHLSAKAEAPLPDQEVGAIDGSIAVEIGATDNSPVVSKAEVFPMSPELSAGSCN